MKLQRDPVTLFIDAGILFSGLIAVLGVLAILCRAAAWCYMRMAG